MRRKKKNQGAGSVEASQEEDLRRESGIRRLRGELLGWAAMAGLSRGLIQLDS